MTPEDALREIRNREDQTTEAALGPVPRWYLVSVALLLCAVSAVPDYVSPSLPYQAAGLALLLILSVISNRSRKARLRRSRYTNKSALLVLSMMGAMLTIFIGLYVVASLADWAYPSTIGAVAMALTWALMTPWLNRAMKATLRRER
ncbi:hypothetical protein [Actinoallomurus rhizosphaericola]|uniref:hypothetical protein n=1 Tax=Actinoallomurus rhizosphaericola TaxID=2952536 RepID=UPI0020913101|nr:hypothetical protein [Actinoallomurus rhizosphaericola]MCO5991969.1 hypothetical protein [Actinoallomurus rhizosphaericola]